MPLPVNIDTTYADDPLDATVKTHQQHHDTLHAGEANAATIYVATDGNDANPGYSWHAPKLTLASAVAALPAGGGRVKLGSGTFDATGPTSVPTNTEIRGSGLNVTTLRLASGSFAAFANTFLITAAVGATNCRVSDLTLDGNRRSGGFAANQGGLLATGSHWTVERVRFYDSAWFKLWINEGSHITVRQCRFDATGSGNDNIGGGGCANVLIEGCYFASDIAGNVFDHVGSSTVTFRKNWSDHISSVCYFEACFDCVVEDNRLPAIYVQSDKGYGTQAQNPRGVRVLRNVLEGGGTVALGIVLSYANSATLPMTPGGGNVVAHNVVRDYANIGIAKVLDFQTTHAAHPQTVGDVCQGNVVINTNRGGGGTYNWGLGVLDNAGIAWSAGRSDIIAGNHVADNQAVPTTAYGVSLAETSGGANAKCENLVVQANTSLGITVTTVRVRNTAQVVNNCRLLNNPGYNPLGPVAVTPAASPWTYTNNDYVPQVLMLQGGIVSSVTKGGVTVLAASPGNVYLEPGQSVVVTYSAAPTAVKDRL